MWTIAIATVLGFLMAPRTPSSEPDGKDPALLIASAIRPERANRLDIPPTLPGAGALLQAPPVLAHIVVPEALEPPPDPEPAVGWISGHVVDGDGNPVGGAILHLRGPVGVQAHRIADDGEFHFAVSEGRWTVEAGLLDGNDEWRSIATTAQITPGATATLAIEILLGTAAHAVHSGIKETPGVGWRVLRDDGPLRRDDVLIEVGGNLLTDMQPEAVRAALRERAGEPVRAVVLRPDDDGELHEVPVVLEAR